MEENTTQVTVVSADCHAGPPLRHLADYVGAAHRDLFDEYLDLTDDYDRRVAEMFAGKREASYEEIHEEFVGRDSVAGLTDPDAHLRDLETDGVVGDVIFPQGVIPFAEYPAQPGMLPPLGYRANAGALAAGCRAYNRWLAEFCATNPGRHAGIAVIPIRDVTAAVREIEWAADAGLRAISLPPISDEYPFFNDPVYEPIWEACAAHDLPLSVHGASTRFYGFGPESLPLALAEIDFFCRRPLWFLIFSGVFERHPSLRLVFTEQRAGWVQPTLNYLDNVYASSVSGLAKILPRPPSSYFDSNCYVGASFMSATEADQRHEIGVSRLMWGSDYPHPEGAWPWSRESLRRTFAQVPETEFRMIVGGNVIDCYGMDRTTLEQAAARVGPTLEELQVPYEGRPEGAHLSWAFRDSDAWA